MCAAGVAALAGLVACNVAEAQLVTDAHGVELFGKDDPFDNMTYGQIVSGLGDPHETRWSARQTGSQRR
jgi:hypothetical protein